MKNLDKINNLYNSNYLIFNLLILFLIFILGFIFLINIEFVMKISFFILILIVIIIIVSIIYLKNNKLNNTMMNESFQTNINTNNINTNNINTNNINTNNINTNNEYIFNSNNFHNRTSYDNLILKPSESCWRKNPSNLPLLDSKNIYVPQGIPLNPNKQINSSYILNNDAPPVDGVDESRRSLFTFAFNQCRPECCPSTFSCDKGCICTTEQQRKFINQRGIINHTKTIF